MSEPVVDLIAVAADLTSSHPRLAKTILHLRDSHSIRTDLLLASDFLASMNVIRSPAIEDQANGPYANSYLALFYSSLLLYVRATKTQNDRRRSFNFVRDFDELERQQHAVLCDLRDQSVAHVGDNKHYRGPAFQIEGVFIPLRADRESKIMTISRRIVIQPSIIESLDQLVHRALMISYKRTQSLNSDVMDLINTDLSQSSDLHSSLKKHIVDFTSFIRDEAEAENIMSGSQAGSQRGTFFWQTD